MKTRDLEGKADRPQRKTVGRVVLLVLLSIPAGYACQAETQAAQEPPPAVAPAPAAQEKPSQNAPGNSDTDPTKPVPASAAGVDPKTFVIGAEDILTVRVWREPELSGQFMVRPDGRISLPLVNEILAAGQTPEQLTASIAQGLSRYMNRPEVAVVVAQVNSRKYYVQGEVNRPGAYPLVVPTTVLEALSNGGGFRDFANTKKIIILRNGKERLQFNYRDVTRGKHTEQNIVLQPGDQIIVN